MLTFQLMATTHFGNGDSNWAYRYDVTFLQIAFENAVVGYILSISKKQQKWVQPSKGCTHFMTLVAESN